jgi:hypothetical protein
MSKLADKSRRIAGESALSDSFPTAKYASVALACIELSDV